MKKLSILCLMALIVGCGKQSEVASTRSHPQKSEIKKAILEMLTQSVDPFLIVEDSKTQKFIQFYNEGGKILIDLPEVALTADEVPLAKKYFATCGISPQKIDGKDPETGKTFVSTSWTAIYAPEQVDDVVNIALGALFDIYGVSQSSQLSFTKGWE
jgi:hypothetical protein